MAASLLGVVAVSEAVNVNMDTPAWLALDLMYQNMALIKCAPERSVLLKVMLLYDSYIAYLCVFSVF